MTQSKDISRTAMTAWILGALAMIAFFGLGIGLKIANENPRYPGCTGWFGIADEQCEYEIASQRLGAL